MTAVRYRVPVVCRLLGRGGVLGQRRVDGGRGGAGDGGSGGRGREGAGGARTGQGRDRGDARQGGGRGREGGGGGGCGDIDGRKGFEEVAEGVRDHLQDGVLRGGEELRRGHRVEEGPPHLRDILGTALRAENETADCTIAFPANELHTYIEKERMRWNETRDICAGRNRNRNTWMKSCIALWMFSSESPVRSTRLAKDCSPSCADRNEERRRPRGGDDGEGESPAKSSCTWITAEAMMESAVRSFSCTASGGSVAPAGFERTVEGRYLREELTTRIPATVIGNFEEKYLPVGRSFVVRGRG